MDKDYIRSIAAAIGIGSMLFGAVPAAAPRQFARLFGFPAPDVATTSIMRSLGVRDAVLGVGLWSAARHGGNYAPWLLARALTDGGDTVSVGLAVASGMRQSRFLALGGLALGAAVSEALLWWTARRMRGDRTRVPEPMLRGRRHRARA